MASSYTKGKALLVIERLDSKWVPFSVTAHIQSLSAPSCITGNIDEDFSLLESDSLPLPDTAYKLKPGETVSVYVVFEFAYTCKDSFWDYGEDDVELYYYKQKILHRSKAKQRYISKKDRTCSQ